MRLSPVILLVLAALLGPRPTLAQSGEPLVISPPSVLPPILRVDVGAPASYDHARLLMESADQQGSGRPTLLLVAGGAAGGALGLIGGMLLGTLVDGPPDEDCRDFCFGPGLILGTLVGEAAGIPLGVHLTNGRRGSLPIGVLTSAGILVLGGLVLLEVPELFLAIPVAQLIGAIRAERITGR
jgi:hypothetical protein